jgi:hypothetical protein
MRAGESDHALRLYFFGGAHRQSRIAGVLATLASALLLIGCAPTDSRFPLYKADQAVFDNHLLGTWQPVITDANARDKDQRWIFSHSEGQQYLQIHFLHDDWVKKQIEAGTFSLAHIDVGSHQILAAQTDDLRKFRQAHADDTEALSSNFQFVRAK